MAPLNTLRKFAAIPAGKKLLLLEAVAWLTVARVALRVVPFPKIGRYLGTMLPPAESAAGTAEDDLLRVRHIGWAVNTAGSHLPVEMVCLPRALAGWQMLHRRGIPSRLHFGVPLDRKTASFETHAWLTTPGVEVTGYPVAHHCVELGYFARTGEP